MWWGQWYLMHPEHPRWRRVLSRLLVGRCCCMTHRWFDCQSTWNYGDDERADWVTTAYIRNDYRWPMETETNDE